ncbi:uncharacterized membrane protein HdeD (DUF308 family) [Humibacillus xanthopallidus]|uniref:Uncharacterized membrane protein HdeD (DUF308 family) n=1 Tax=Humibacillus xanthopallidus TaxID=412689 RepID=A0A543HGC2_9MICO|nr:uncharacterized membrane protein HdeD (DUF308 family) [Humibacillus xanthopallidus]
MTTTAQEDPDTGERRATRRRTPWVLQLLVGVVAVLVGAFLTLNPFSSLAVLLVAVVVGLVVTGFGELAARDDEQSSRRWPVVKGVLYLAAALAVLVWPGATIRVVAVVVGLALVLGGIADVLAGASARGTARWNGIIGGAASIVFGLLALAWPDVSVLVIAVVFGAKVVLLGVRLVIDAIRRARGRDTELGAPAATRPGRARPGWWRLAGTVVGAAVAVVLMLVSLALHRGTPQPDAFYSPPGDVPSQPGQLLRVEPFTRAVPADAKGWRILYTTTSDDGVPAVASALVVTPKAAAGPTPVIAWAHGTTGASPGCAPSVLDKTFESGALFVVDRVVQQGWTLVATDYIGLGTTGVHPYLIGQGEGRSVLDAIRAAHAMKDVSLADDTVVWGHSQGGHAALWTGILASTYAPELKIDGVAAMAPASNLPGLIRNLDNVTAGELFASYVVQAYTSTYPDVRFSDVVRPGAQILVREMAQRCLAEPGTLVSIASTLVLDKPMWQGNPDSGAFHERLVENTPSGPIAAPLLLAEGGADQLVIPAAQDAYVKGRCDAGYAVDYRTYPGKDHVPLVEADSPLIPELLTWTQDRFAGKPARNTC